MVYGLFECSYGMLYVSLVSIGVSLLDVDVGWSEWYVSVDWVLYWVKCDGGNCLCWVDDLDG